MNELHDFNVTVVEVNCADRYIVLHAVGMSPSEDEVQAVFEGVTGHHFEHVLEGNIINQVSRVHDPVAFYAANEQELRRYAAYGLSLDVESAGAFTEDLHRRELCLYEIFSSYGLSGWLCCRKFNVVPVPKRRA